MNYDYDLFVIGAGSGGVRAARIAAGFGARVAIAEEYRVGGTCVIRGCVPKKLMVYASHFAEEFAAARGFGWTVGETSFDWRRFIDAKDTEIDRLNSTYITTLKNAGVELMMGRAIVAGAHTVRLGERTLSAETILIATGGTPTVPDIPGAEHAITSNEAFHLPDLPARVVVVGGGYIAVEFAGIFNGMGAQVTQLYRGEQILRGFDGDEYPVDDHRMVGEDDRDWLLARERRHVRPADRELAGHLRVEEELAVGQGEDLSAEPVAVGELHLVCASRERCQDQAR